MSRFLTDVMAPTTIVASFAQAETKDFKNKIKVAVLVIRRLIRAES